MADWTYNYGQVWIDYDDKWIAAHELVGVQTGFDTQADAQAYLDSYGSIDSRTSAAVNELLATCPSYKINKIHTSTYLEDGIEDTSFYGQCQGVFTLIGHTLSFTPKLGETITENSQYSDHASRYDRGKFVKGVITAALEGVGLDPSTYLDYDDYNNQAILNEFENHYHDYDNNLYGSVYFTKSFTINLKDYEQ